MYVAFIKKTEKKEEGEKCPYLLTSSAMWLAARVAHLWIAEGQVILKTKEPHHYESIDTAQIKVECSMTSLDRVPHP